jgi:hypothetical protein
LVRETCESGGIAALIFRLADGGSTNANASPSTIGGGPNSGSSGDHATASTNAATGITISRPANRAANDFLLLTVTGQGAAVTASSTICPSTTTTGWTLVDQKRVSGTLIQETYSSFRPTNAAETYTFNFFTGTCGAGAGNLTLAASALVVRYTNVASLDTSSGATGSPTSANLAGSALSTTWTASSGSYASGTIPSLLRTV